MSDLPGYVRISVAVGALPAHTALAERYEKTRSTHERVPVPNQGEWTEDGVSAMCHKIRSNEGRKAFHRIAAAHGAWVTYQEMADAAGIGIDQLKAQLAWFSKFAKSLRGINEWPIEIQRNLSLPKGERFKYRMPPKIAEWWLKAEASLYKEDEAVRTLGNILYQCVSDNDGTLVDDFMVVVSGVSIRGWYAGQPYEGSPREADGFIYWSNGERTSYRFLAGGRRLVMNEGDKKLETIWERRDA